MPLRFNLDLKARGIKVGEPFVISDFERCHCSEELVKVFNTMTIYDDYIYVEKLCTNCGVVEYTGTVAAWEKPEEELN